MTRKLDDAGGRAESRPVAMVADPSRIPASPHHALSATLAARLLTQFGQPLCIVDSHAAISWSNSAFDACPPEVIEAIRAAGQAAFLDWPHAASADPLAPAPPSGARRALNVGRDYAYDLAFTPVRDESGTLTGVAVLAWDTSVTRRIQQRVNAIDAAGKELVRLDLDALARMDVAERLKVLEDKILGASRDLLHFDHLVVRVLDPKTRRLDTVIAGGLSEDAKSLEIYASAEGNGITGYVAATGRSQLCPDVTKDPRYLPGLESARSSLTVPLWLHDQVVGTFNVESEKVGVFTENDLQFAEIFGRYIALALHTLKLLVVERHTVTEQLAADVRAEISAPLSEISAEAGGILALYAGHEELLRRVGVIRDQVERIRAVIKAVAEGQVLEGLAPRSAERDPILSGKRILVAEDEDIIRETVADVLARCGAIPVPARDGNEAVALLALEPFDLVLSDIKMPHKTGYEVFSAAKARAPDLPVILITGFGYDPEHSIVRATREGLAGVLFKPFKVEQLLTDVRRALSPAANTST